MKLTRYTGTGEWSALYVDGELDTAGDHYLIDERIEELTGIESHSSDAFMRGGDYHSDVAQTLAEIDEYERKQSERFERAEELRAQAARLLAEAERLEED